MQVFELRSRDRCLQQARLRYVAEIFIYISNISGQIVPADFELNFMPRLHSVFLCNRNFNFWQQG